MRPSTRSRRPSARQFQFERHLRALVFENCRTAGERPNLLGRRSPCTAQNERISVVSRKPRRVSRRVKSAQPPSATPALHDVRHPLSRPTRHAMGARIVRTATSTAVALALAGTAPSLWAAGTCTVSDISGCGAAGGDGASGRGGPGGAGNGQGGGSSTIDSNSVTVQVPGGWAPQGTGGTGASGDGGTSSGGAPAQVVFSSGFVVNGPVVGPGGLAGADGTNFASGGNGGGAGLYYLGDDITVSSAGAIVGGAGGQGGNASAGVGNGGGGGGGGAGMISAGVVTSISNSGTISGGAGGNGGAGGFSGGGGAGGDGILSLQGSANIFNIGTISGGAGGAVRHRVRQGRQARQGQGAAARRHRPARLYGDALSGGAGQLCDPPRSRHQGAACPGDWRTSAPADLRRILCLRRGWPVRGQGGHVRWRDRPAGGGVQLQFAFRQLWRPAGEAGLLPVRPRPDDRQRHRRLYLAGQAPAAWRA